MYVVNIIFDDVSLDTVDIYRTMVDAYMWHRRMGYCNPRALHQLTDKDQSGVKFNRHINSGDCEVCSAGNNEKSSHPPSDRPRAQTRLEIVHADVWGKHSVESYGGCQSAVMCTDDHSRMRWGVPLGLKMQRQRDSTRLSRRLLTLQALGKCTAMEGRSSRTHSVMVLPKSMSKPDPRVMSKLKRVFRYLKGTVSIGITYSEDANDGAKLTA